MKSHLPLIAMLLFVFASCSSDDNTNETTSDLRLVEVKSFTADEEGNQVPGFSNSIFYEYGSNGFVSRVIQLSEDIPESKYGYTAEYTYNSNDEVISYSHFENNGDSYEIDYIYENGLIIKEVFSNNNDYTEYEYQDNRVSEAHHYSPDNPEYNYSNSLEYNASGNLLHVIDNSTQETLATYEYDDKINPYYTLFPSSYKTISVTASNNVIGIIRPEEYECNTVRTFTYNDLNYPLKVLYHDCNGNPHGIEFIYE